MVNDGQRVPARRPTELYTVYSTASIADYPLLTIVAHLPTFSHMAGGTVEIEGAADPLPNPRHEAFARLVASGMAHAAAYREAGYNSKSPDVHAARLVDSGSIAARIAYLRMETAKAVTAASLVDAHRIQQELECVALADIGEAFEDHEDGDGQIITRAKPIKRWPEALRRAVQKVKVKRYLEGSGDNAREVELIEFALAPKVPAVHELRAHMGLLKPRDINVTVSGVIALPVLHVPQPTAADRVLDGEHGAEVRASSMSAGALSSARASLLAHLSQPRQP